VASIDKRPNGTFLVRWREYPSGPQKTKSFSRKVDAQRHRTTVEHALLSGSYVKPEAARVSLEQYARAHIARQPWTEATADIARNALLTHAVRFFGADRPLASIRKADVQAFVTGLKLAPSSVRTLYQHLSGLLSAAVEDKLLVTNPARGVRLPRALGGEVVPPSEQDVAALLGAAPPWFVTAVVLGAGLGLRQGEASGLTEDRVSWLAERSVRIDRQWSTRRGPGAFAPPKSPSSVRTVPASDWVLAQLALTAVTPGGFVLHEDGAPVSHHRFAYMWRQTVKEAGLAPGLRFHELRHRFASQLLSKRCSIVAVQRAMGHSKASITLDLYGHLMGGDDDRIREAITWAPPNAEDSLRTGDPDR
jgi:integrase